jgi:uncharacterized cupin superfamily protein
VRKAILMKTFIITVISCALAGSLLAANPPGTGQPGVECEDVHPGNASSARGSAFNEDGVAGTVYAGEQDVNSKNPKSVSQYDVACFQQESRIAKLLSRLLGTDGGH